jgi:PadR family transcriptional regulator
MASVIRGALNPVILALLDQQPDHGYGLLARLRGAYGFQISDGSLYPALYRLEELGFIAGTWEFGERRKRKVLRITPKGRKHLAKSKVDSLELASLYRRIFGRRAQKASTA